jgi:hypothetical protein
MARHAKPLIGFALGNHLTILRPGVSAPDREAGHRACRRMACEARARDLPGTLPTGSREANCESLAPIRAIHRPVAVRIALSGEMRANFFLGANPVFRKPRLRDRRASGMLSRRNAGALISN